MEKFGFSKQNSSFISFIIIYIFENNSFFILVDDNLRSPVALCYFNRAIFKFELKMYCSLRQLLVIGRIHFCIIRIVSTIHFRISKNIFVAHPMPFLKRFIGLASTRSSKCLTMEVGQWFERPLDLEVKGSIPSYPKYFFPLKPDIPTDS